MKYLLLILISSISTILAINVPSPPLIVKQPPPEVFFGENLVPVLECEALGEPNPTYRWEKNGVEFNWQVFDNRISQQPGRGSLAFTGPKPEDVGIYQCFATNEYGTSMSSVTRVERSKLDDFISYPLRDMYATEGEPFSIPCFPPESVPKADVTWVLTNYEWNVRFINNSRISVDPNGILWFSNVTKADESYNYVYTCSAFNNKLNLRRLGYRVDLKVNPSSGLKFSRPIVQYVSKDEQVAVKGKRHELHCIFGGTPLPSIIWKKDWREIANSSDKIKVLNYGKTLILDEVSFEHEGMYSCIGSNELGSKIHMISLLVESAPYLITQIESMVVEPGETVNFNCRAGGKPHPLTEITYNGKPIKDVSNLVLKNVTKSNTGTYGCNVSNYHGSVYHEATLTVLTSPPEFVVPPKGQRVILNSSVNITCEVFGVPKPKIVWKFNGTELLRNRFEVNEKGLLIKNLIDSSYQGEYTCLAENKYGSIQHSATVQIVEPTRTQLEPTDASASKGGSVEFKCHITVDKLAKLRVVWLKDDVPINFENDGRIFKSGHSLFIKYVIDQDAGSYECQAMTDFDESSSSSELTVLDRIPECGYTNASIITVPIEKTDDNVRIQYSLIPNQDIIIRPVGQKNNRNWIITLSGNQIILTNKNSGGFREGVQRPLAFPKDQQVLDILRNYFS